VLDLERRMNAIMGMNLSGEGGYFRFSSGTWRAVLELAHEHGWEPAGTTPPEITVYAPDGVTVDEVATRAERQRYANWDGGYFWNEYQVEPHPDVHLIDDLTRTANSL
jgi:hypothetical protein